MLAIRHKIAADQRSSDSILLKEAKLMKLSYSNPQKSVT